MTELEKAKEWHNIFFDKIREATSIHEQIKKSGEIKHKNETGSLESFINTLFKALGSNPDNWSNKTYLVCKEETMSKNWIDYGVDTNRNPKFSLKVGSLKGFPLSILLFPPKTSRRMFLDNVLIREVQTK